MAGGGEPAMEVLRTCLQAAYGLDAPAIQPLLLGLDVSAWRYRVRTEGHADTFLKVRAGEMEPTVLLVPRLLHDSGLTRVIAPLRTTTGALSARAGGYSLALYPYVESRTAKEQRLSAREWRDYGALLRRVHDTRFGPAIEQQLRRDPLRPATARLRRLDAHVDAGAVEGPAQRALAAFWQAQRPAMLALAERAEGLASRLAAMSPSFVLCHGDIHAANVLLDTAGGVWFTDWDDVQLSLPERDLMMVLDGGLIPGLAGPREEALFLEGYGPIQVNPVAFAYYQHCRAIDDLAELGEQVFLRSDLGQPAHQAALANFQRLFEPASIVPTSLAADLSP